MCLKPCKLGMTGAIMMAVCYLIEALTYMFAPAYVVKMWSLMSYNFDYQPILGTGLTWGTFFLGLVCWVVMAFVGLFVFAWLYNKLLCCCGNCKCEDSTNCCDGKCQPR